MATTEETVEVGEMATAEETVVVGEMATAEETVVEMEDMVTQARRGCGGAVETKRLLSQSKITSVVDPEIEKRYNKIVQIFKKQPKPVMYGDGGDHVDEGNQEERPEQISMETMRFVIKCLDTSSSWFHGFMNIFPFHESEDRKELLKELEKIDVEKNNVISLEDFINLTAIEKSGEASPSQKMLLKHIQSIADAKKIDLTWKLTIFFVLALVLLLIFALDEKGEVREAFVFDT